MSEIETAFTCFGGAIPSVTFKSADAVIEYIDKHISFYRWLDWYKNHENISEVIEWTLDLLQETREIVRTSGASDADAERIRNKMNSTFDNGGIPTVGHPRSEYIKYLRDHFDGATAIGALGYYTNKIDKVSNSAFLKGALLAANNETISRPDIDKSFHEMNRGYEFLTEKMDLEITKIQNISKAYSEAMPLRAPVDYWRSKAKAHRNKSSVYRDFILQQGWKYGAGLFAVLFVLICITHWLVDKNASLGAYIGPITLGVLLATVALWAARICVRLYMSEHHLYIDAEERAVMVQTYLSLIQDGALTKEDRTLVLTPLFRASTDGIVKDDGAPDATVAAIISKALSRP